MFIEFSKALKEGVVIVSDGNGLPRLQSSKYALPIYMRPIQTTTNYGE